MTSFKTWESRVGSQRDWVWRGWQIRYTYLGDKVDDRPPLIIIHGFGASIGHWRDNLPVLSQSYRVYALDLLGFGASRKPNMMYRVNLWCDLVYEFWKTFVKIPVVLLGNSIGSLICLAATNRYPEMGGGLVMVNLPDPFIREELLPRWLLPLVLGLEGLFTSSLILRFLFYVLRSPRVVKSWAKFAYGDPDKVSDELVDILSSPAQDIEASGAFPRLFKAMMSCDECPRVKSALSSLVIPILLVWGKRDRMIPFSLAQQFIPLNPRLTFMAFDEAGHCVHDECPDEFNRVLLDWLSFHFGR